MLMARRARARAGSRIPQAQLPRQTLQPSHCDNLSGFRRPNDHGATKPDLITHLVGVAALAVLSSPSEVVGTRCWFLLARRSRARAIASSKSTLARVCNARNYCLVFGARGPPVEQATAEKRVGCRRRCLPAIACACACVDRQFHAGSICSDVRGCGGSDCGCDPDWRGGARRSLAC